MKYTERMRGDSGRSAGSVLRGPAGQFLLDTLPVEADDPHVPDLDHPHPRLPGLADDVASRTRITLQVYLLERNPVLLEASLGRFATREQAEWRAKELNEWSERNPRGYVQYLVRPVEKPRERD
jgi:hypothetical protein